MAMVRNGKKINPSEERRIDWTSDNGIWKVIGWEKPHPFRKNFMIRDVNIFKLQGGSSVHSLFPIGRRGFKKYVPTYVLNKYEEIDKEIWRK